jgi:outer membrane receptor protein involved in Fe transport
MVLSKYLSKMPMLALEKEEWSNVSKLGESTMQSHLVRSLWKAFLAFIAGVSFVIASGNVANAQAQTNGEEQEDGALEEIVVTGSRIRRASYDMLQPSVEINSEFMDDRGFANVAEGLNQLPAFGIGVSNSGRQEGPSVGQNFVNAFGLGSQRTLTLINGRRVVGQNTPGIGSAAQAGLQVDLNIIPTALVERIETVFIGGAPIYGSDAVAATVNIILKDDFEGFSVDLQYGIDGRGDLPNGRFRALWGANVDGGRGNVTVSAEYSYVGTLDSRENSIARRQTAFCENPAAGIGGTGFPIVDPNDGIPDLILCDDAVNVWQVPNSGMPLLPGAFLAFPTGVGTLQDAQGNNLTFDADGSLVTFAEANLGTPRGVFFSVGADGFNNQNVFTLADRSPLVSPLDRWIQMATAHYDLTSNTRVIFEGMFTRSESNATPFDVPGFSTNVFAPGAEGAIRVNINDNPFITQELRDALIFNNAFDPNLGEDQFFQITRSNADIVKDNRDFREQNVFRYLVGLEGDVDFLGRAWTWDAVFSSGETNSTSRLPELNGARYALALDAVTDPNTGEVVCRAQIDPPESVFDNVFVRPTFTDITDCIPFNPIGFQNVTQEQLEYLVQDDFQSTKIRQLYYEANIVGELLDLPAGPVSIALGAQYRREEASFHVDRSTLVGVDPNDPVLPVSGKFDTKEIYAETVIPIVGNGVGPGFDVPFLASLQLEGAIRLVDNSRSGNDTTWTAGGRLRPNLPLFGDGLTIRGNFTKSIRSPSVQELFLPRSQVNVFAEDPCDPEFINAGPNPALRRTNCEANVQSAIQSGLIPADFDLSTFESLIDNRTTPGITGGNPNLSVEEADSWTVGVVISPPFLPGFRVSLDWTSIEIGNEIVSLSPTQLLNGCFDASSYPNVGACDRFTRDMEFQIRNPETGFLNAAIRKFSGLVGNLSYSFSASDLVKTIPGSFELSGSFFHLSEMERVVAAGAVDILTAERGFERNRWQLNLRYDTDDRFMALLQTQFIGEFKVDAQAAPERFVPGEGTGSSVIFFNLTTGYQLTDTIGLRVVVNNLFDERDGRTRSASALTGSGTDPFQPLDVVGRRFLFAITGNF